MGRDKLIMPAGLPSEVPRLEEPPKEKEQVKNGGGDDFGGQDALIVGLFRKLPPPSTEWNEEDRQKWLQTAANIFDLVYTGECGGFHITPARADRSPRPREH